MAFKQPRVPEYRENESMSHYLKTLTLFLKDFCQEAWTASGQAEKGIAGISYPVTSVFSRTGDVALLNSDVAGVQKGTWDGNTAPSGIPNGVTYVDGAAASSTGFPAGYVVCLAAKVSVYRLMQILVEKTNGNLWVRSATDSTTWGEWKKYMTTADTAANSNKLGGKTFAEIMLSMYPVGAVYLSTASTSPASLFGGTWEQIKDRFLLSAGGSYSAGTTGGEATHTLTVDEMPSHIHRLGLRGGGSGDGGNAPFAAGKVWGQVGTGIWNDYSDGKIESTGGDAAHNNMPPYLAVYMWKRVS